MAGEIEGSFGGIAPTEGKDSYIDTYHVVRTPTVREWTQSEPAGSPAHARGREAYPGVKWIFPPTLVNPEEIVVG